MDFRVDSNNAVRHVTPSRIPSSATSARKSITSRRNSAADHNADDFVYGRHFTFKERIEMLLEKWSETWKYRARLIKRKLLPSWSVLFRTFQAILLVLMISKYALDCYSDRKQEFSTTLVETIEKMKGDVVYLSERQANLLEELHEIHKLLQNPVQDESFEEKADHFRSNLSRLEAAIEAVRSEAVNGLRALGQELTSVASREPLPNAPYEGYLATAMAGDPPTVQTAVIRRVPQARANLANSLIGARVIEKTSSKSAPSMDSYMMNIMAYVMPSQRSGYAILDREIVQPGEAWCTIDKKPMLTVRLAKKARITSVSYQHVSWSEIAPQNAPKLYDVVACQNECCTKWTPLAIECVYGVSKDGNQAPEQFCAAVNDEATSTTRIVQFRFKQNHGNTQKTCVYLVRVYGDVIGGMDEEASKDHVDDHLVETAGTSMVDSVLSKLNFINRN